MKKEKYKVCENILKELEKEGSITRISGFEFGEPIPLTKCLEDILEPVEDVQEKYYLRNVSYSVFPEVSPLSEKPLSKFVKVAVLDKKGFNGSNKVYSKKSISPCLTAHWGGGGKIKVFVDKPVEAVRNLTPIEYWRLQDFPDEAFYKAKEAGVSDTQLYKQAGNSMSCNILEMLFKQLKQTIEEGTNYESVSQ